MDKSWNRYSLLLRRKALSHVVQCTVQEFECNLNRPMLSWPEVCTPNVQSFTHQLLYTSIPETMESRSTTHSSHVPIILHSADVIWNAAK